MKPYGIHDIIGDKRDTILQLAEKYGFTNVRVFGSVARGEANDTSDVDILLDYYEPPTLIELAGLHRELEALLGRSVDIAIAKNLRERIYPRVMRDAVALSNLTPQP